MEDIFKAMPGFYRIVAQDKGSDDTRVVAEPNQLTTAQHMLHVLHESKSNGTVYTLCDKDGPMDL